VITRPAGAPSVELWVCQRCATRKELTQAELERGHSWQGMRGKRKRED
jgi:hypothetical protein